VPEGDLTVYVFLVSEEMLQKVVRFWLFIFIFDCHRDHGEVHPRVAPIECQYVNRERSQWHFASQKCRSFRKTQKEEEITRCERRL
jgi:hypothetical protein